MLRNEQSLGTEHFIISNSYCNKTGLLSFFVYSFSSVIGSNLMVNGGTLDFCTKIGRFLFCFSSDD